MLRIAICDDDRNFLDQLKQLLVQWNPEARVTVFDDGDALIRAHTAAPFDILLLDVVMPLVSGIDLASEIREQDKTVKIVFLTSSPEFAVDSYRVKASNYLLKPLDPQALYSCLNELSRELAEKEHFLTVKSAYALHRIPLDTIEYVEAQNKHVLFSLTDGRVLTSTEPLYTHEPLLTQKDGFYKCSRSYIVNMHRIVSYTAKEVRLRSGSRIPISRSCQRDFEAAYFAALFGKAGDWE